MFDKFKHTHLENYNQINEVPISRINTRIEAVNDPKVNKILFSLYEKMVEPYRRIEAKISRVNDLQEAIDDNKDYTKCSFSRVIYFSKYLFIPLIIANLIIVFSNSQNDEFITKYFPLSDFFEFVLDKFDSLFLEILSVAYVMVLHPIFVAMIFIGIIVIIVNIIHMIENKKNQKEIDELTPVINKEIYDLSEVSCYIPPDYRYSKALDFFVNAYSNSKVDNLKEAVNLFDTNEYRENMLYYQQKLCELQEEILYVELEQLNQLNSLSRDVWFSEVLF